MDMSDAPVIVQEFVKQEMARMESLGVRCLLVPESTAPYLDTDMRVGGYFCDKPPTLAVAIGKPWEEWLPVFVHEGCHMDQWSERATCWVNNTLSDGQEAVEWLDEWCAGTRELSVSDLQHALKVAQAVEMDCEDRVLQKIEEFNLPLDKESYAQKSNAYVHFYTHMIKTKKWYPPNRAPYELEEVWKSAPTSLSWEMPASLAAAFDRAYPLSCEPCKKMSLAGGM